MYYLLVTLFLASPSLGGFIVTAKVSQGGTDSPLRQFYQGANTKLEFQPSPSTQTSLIYRGDKGMLAWIDHGKKSFLEASESDLNRLTTLFSAFRKQKQTPTTKVQFKKGASVVVGKWNCTRYSVLAGDKKTGQICIVPLKEIGATPADFKPLVTLAKTMTSLGFIPPEQRGYLDSVEGALNIGFVAESESYDGAGKLVSKMLVEKVSKETLADSTFSMPAGYQRNDLTSLLQQQIMKPSGK